MSNFFKNEQVDTGTRDVKIEVQYSYDGENWATEDTDIIADCSSSYDNDNWHIVDMSIYQAFNIRIKITGLSAGTKVKHSGNLVY